MTVVVEALWSQMEKKLHINCLELLPESFAVKSFTKNRLCVHVGLRMDNTSAVDYLNCLDGTSSLVLSNLALALWEWALKRNIFCSAKHLARLFCSLSRSAALARSISLRIVSAPNFPGFAVGNLLLALFYFPFAILACESFHDMLMRKLLAYCLACFCVVPH